MPGADAATVVGQQHHVEVEAGGAGVEAFEQADLQARDLDLGQGRVMGAEHDTEQRVVRAGGVQGQRAGQLLDRHLLVRQSADEGVGHLVHGVLRRRRGVQAKVQRDGVDEHAHGVLEAARPVADRGADDHPGASAVAAQEFREEPEQRRERGQTALARVGAQPLRQVGADRLTQLSAVVPSPRPWPGETG